MKNPFFFVVFLIGALFFVDTLIAEEISLASEKSPVQAPVVKSQLALDPEAIEIERLWSAGKKSKANRALKQWMKRQNKSPWPWVEASSLQFREKRYQRGLSYLKTALAKSPQCAEAYYWRGRSYEALNKPLEAANEYRAALLAEEKYNEAQEALARVLVQLGWPSPQ